jgi:RHS repeat-associated protein
VTITQGGKTTTLASGFTYDPAGNLVSVTLGNGLVSTQTFDGADRVASIEVPGVESFAYSYDSVGNITGIADGIDPAFSKTFAYDPLNRLNQAGGSFGTQTYTYDPNGNRLSMQSGTTTSYTYQANRLATVTDGGTLTYQYDAAGEITSDGSKTFVYNQNRRLIRVLDGSTVLGEYTYDGQGRRVIKQTHVTQHKKTVTVTVVFHYDNRGRLIEETDETGTLVAEYIWLGSRPLAMVRKVHNKEEVYYFHNDHLGTPAKVTDKSGSVAWDVEFDPFGNVTGGTLWNVENNLRFPGQYYDAESGLHYNYFRDYDPKTGRYVEADPVGVAGGVNLYPYVDGNPLTYTDPLGLVPNPLEGACVLGPNPVCIGGVAGDIVTWVAAAVAVTGAVSYFSTPVNDPVARAEHDTYKERASQVPPPNLDECERLKWLLKREQDVVQGMQAWDAKWQPGRHAKAIQQRLRSIDKLKEMIKEKCGSCD